MSFLENYWRGKTVLITGASSGLGAALVDALAPYGVRFCLLSRRSAPMAELAGCWQSQSQFWWRECDVRSRTEVDRCVDDFVATHGPIDVAWINSGVSYPSSARRWSWDATEAMLETNLNGAMYTTMAALRHMIPRGRGAVVGIGSAASMRGIPARSVYSMTKIALEYFLESLACELPDVQFTIIHPGFVDTPINTNAPGRIFLLTPENAAGRMITAVAKGRRIFIYPKRMALLYHLVRWLPSGLYRKLSRRAMQLNKVGSVPRNL